MESLTTKQSMLLAFLIDYVQRHGFGPALRDIAEHFDVNHGAITNRLQILERKGYISIERNMRRSIRVLLCADGTPYTGVAAAPPDTIALPLFAARATPIDSENADANTQPEGVFQVATAQLRDVRNAIAVRVHGDSMRDVGILSNDILLVDRGTDSRSGDVVVARVENTAYVKRLRREGPEIFLDSENSAYAPLPVRHENSEIVGKVVGLIRQY